MTIDELGNLHDNGNGRFTGKPLRDGDTALRPAHTLQTELPIERQSLYAANRRAREVARYNDDGRSSRRDDSRAKRRA